MYNTLSATESESSGEIIDDVSGMESLMMEEQNDLLEKHLKHEMVMKMWEGVQKLKKAMIRHVYKLKHGEEALKTAEDFCDGYNPLNI